ncbi:hypothetical protein [Frondihabitans cladoniiphilus]|uniref:Calx-beta domain-containing protein n=1 Tax=Frondihabitans cladoniiphilus TaxID=715785 RepID=A0ABP8VXL0_9MICO
MVLTAGCNFISPQTTTEHYEASDGTSIDVGKIEVRNAMVFTDDSGETASLSVTVLNTGDSTASVGFQYTSSVAGDTTETVSVPANGQTRRGTQGGDKQIILSDIDKKPGTLLKVFIQSGDTTGKTLSIPVLDGSFSQYKTLLPSPSPISTPTATPLISTPTATTTPTP